MSKLQYIVHITLSPLSLYEPRVDNLSWGDLGSYNILGTILGLTNVHEFWGRFLLFFVS